MRWHRKQQGAPAHAPDYLITLAGQRISPELEARLISLRLTDRRGVESDQLDITLDDHDGRLELPRRGAELELSLGWQHQGLVNRGTYIVDEVEHAGAPDQLIIRARAADLRGNLPVKRERSWHEALLGDILEEISGRHGLIPSINQGLAGQIIEHIDQTDESDMHFLTRLGERYDAIAAIKAGHLLFVPAGQGETASGAQIPPLRLTRTVGDAHTYIATEREGYTGVIAFWHDPDTAERHPVLVGDDTRAKRLRGNQANEDDAKAEAKAEWQRIRRGGGRMMLTLAEGRADVYPETPVQLEGWKPEIDAVSWVVEEVVHNLSEAGYSCGLQMEAADEVE